MGYVPIFLLLLAACAPLPPPGATLLFGALGDAPYTEGEIERLDGVIAEMNRGKLAFVVHVGDIGSSARACDDAWLDDRKRQLAKIRPPFVLVPGDNEWANCKAPLARLKAWRARFCHWTALKVEVQEGEYCEHVRWEADGRIFVTLNVPGHDNNAGHPEHAPRMRAALAWLDEAAILARERKGLVVFMQANPFFPASRGGFTALRKRLRALGERMPGRVVLVHGDTHLYRDDEPLPGVRRIEVWGSPFVAWTPVALGEGP